MSAAVLVIGSANQDIVVKVPRIPGVGETIAGSEVDYLPGGKGLNQASACGATGVSTYFLGAVGGDEHGRQLTQTLESYGVNTDLLSVCPGVATGSAHILVSESGGNQIAIVAGANDEVSTERVQWGRSIPNVGVVVIQGEIPTDANQMAARIAKDAQARLVFNLAPVASVPETLLQQANPLVVNEYEAGLVMGEEAPASVEVAKDIAARLSRRCQSVIVTLGAMGAVVAQDGECSHIPAIDCGTVVDTTGAGDAFVGVLASALAKGSDLLSAAREASEASALTVTQAGASASYGLLRDKYCTD